MRKIAFYLPQFHREPLNEDVWGAEFTDWVTSQNARPLYKGHKQPIIPKFDCYDLDDDCATLTWQIEEAKQVGLDAFSYYFYSFSPGVGALRKPLEAFLKSSLDFPFLITWANHSWTKAWVGDHNSIIAEQKYDRDQVENFCKSIEQYILDDRYVLVDGRPVVCVLNIGKLDLVYLKSYLGKILFPKFGKNCQPYIVVPYQGYTNDSVDLYIGWPPGDVGLAQIQDFPHLKKLLRVVSQKLDIPGLFRISNIGPENKLLSRQLENCRELNRKFNFSQTILTGWDNTPRYGNRGYQVLHTSKGEYIDKVREILKMNATNGAPITFIKSWNEWAEGNVIEKSKNGIDYSQLLSLVLEFENQSNK